MSIRKILLKMIENHFQPCACLACRKGGRIDVVLLAIKQEVKKVVGEDRSTEGENYENFNRHDLDDAYNQAKTEIRQALDKLFDEVRP